MGFVEILEIIVCVFAAYGIYSLLCHIIAAFCQKDAMAIGIQVAYKDAQDPFPNLEEHVRYAVLLTEEHRGNMQPPVLLLDADAEDACVEILREYGYEIFRKIKKRD